LFIRLKPVFLCRHGPHGWNLIREVLEKVQAPDESHQDGIGLQSHHLRGHRLKELGLTTLEERRHQADMVQTYKIVTGKDRVNRNSETWFTSVTESGRPTRNTADGGADPGCLSQIPDQNSFHPGSEIFPS
jgi:hypothetical protein